MGFLENKKVIIIGDRDGIPGLAIGTCVNTVPNTEVIFSSTECFLTYVSYGLRKPKES